MKKCWSLQTEAAFSLSIEEDEDMANLELMNEIMKQKDADIAANGTPGLNEETKALASQKRFTFDVIVTPADPLR